MPQGTPDSALDGALEKGIRFLLKAQSGDGSFTDWDLPPGPSTAWTTAYVAGALAALPDATWPRIPAATRAAAQWLAGHESDGGGWGYNAAVGADADSTAHAILLLAQEDVPITSASRDRLLSFQRADGGFSTYGESDGMGSWGESHADVTAVCGRALLALGESPVLPALRRCLAFIAAQRTPHGMWNSFWWRSPLVATQASLALLGAAAVAIDADATRIGLDGADASNAFERALWLECRVQSGAASADTGIALREALLAEQQADGGWLSAPVLRVTRRDCAAPWAAADAGTLYADTRRLFTTATVLRALAAASAAAGVSRRAPSPGSR